MEKESKVKSILKELADHLPFTIFGVSMSLLLIGILTFFSILIDKNNFLALASSELFHVFHPIHILFSAIATTAMFSKHERNVLKASFVGLLGSIIICGLSDLLFPFVGGTIIGAKMHMHICLINNPGLVISFALTGVIAGILVTKSLEYSTEYSHSAHVFVSSAASILYLLSYGVVDWIHSIGSILVITIFAVIIPCCTSDIILPLACLHKGCGCDKDCAT